MATYQILVKLLDGKTHCLQFATPTISGEALAAAVSSLSNIPAPLLRLVSGRHVIAPSTLLTTTNPNSNLFPSATALLRLRGGKGGFGSLLRGAASKAGHKKTSNFDACRDMSGRRIRHVNAERRLQEWNAEAGDRKLEKIAEEFIKKKAKDVKSSKSAGGGGGEVEKYLEKFRRDAEKCVGEVEESVKASLVKVKVGKRKGLMESGTGSDAKKLKIWLGKQKMDESDSEDDEEEQGAKSAVIDEGNSSEDASEKGDGRKSEGEQGSQGSDLEENGNSGEESLELAPSSESENGNSESDCGMVEEPALPNGGIDGLELAAAAAAGLVEVPVSNGTKVELEVERNVGVHKELVPNEPEVGNVEVSFEKDNASPILEEALDFGKYNSSVELEVLGMDRLKAELQRNGLKCGGTLQERASRLFLLKTNPLDKLPKKLLAKPGAGGK